MKLKDISIELAKIDRDRFLRKTLLPYLPSNEIEQLIKEDQLSENISEKTLKRMSDELIRKRCLYVGGLSLSTSLYGTASTLLLLPLDCAQFTYHTMKLAQELYYIHGTRNMFTYKSNEELELLVYMLAGASSAIAITGSTLGTIIQKLYAYTFSKMRLKSLSLVPFVGSVAHGSLSAYALRSLAQEYIVKLESMVAENVETTPAQVAKEIGTFIDVEYKEVEGKIRSFCNLEKLREYYQYVEAGYLSEEEFEQLKFDI